MVTQQQTDGLWPDRGLVGNRSMLSKISHTSGKLSSVLLDGSAEKETDLYKNAQGFFNHCLYLNHILSGRNEFGYYF